MEETHWNECELLDLYSAILTNCAPFNKVGAIASWNMTNSFVLVPVTIPDIQTVTWGIKCHHLISACRKVQTAQQISVIIKHFVFFPKRKQQQKSMLIYFFFPFIWSKTQYNCKIFFKTFKITVFYFNGS